MDKNNELYHFGILGMKWGVRRSKAQLGRGKKKSSMSDDAKEASLIKKKKVSSMSNAELRKYNERSRLEQEYSKLNPTKIKKGMAMAAATAGTLATVSNLYTNGGKILEIGKKIADRIK